MRTVGLKTLKERLGEYVRAASEGETVLVTDSNRVVAELVPPRPGRLSGGTDERYEQAVRAGVITRASHTAGGSPSALPGMTFDDLMEALQRDRAER